MKLAHSRSRAVPTSLSFFLATLAKQLRQQDLVDHSLPLPFSPFVHAAQVPRCKLHPVLMQYACFRLHIKSENFQVIVRNFLSRSGQACNRTWQHELAGIHRRQDIYLGEQPAKEGSYGFHLPHRGFHPASKISSPLRGAKIGFCIRPKTESLKHCQYE